MATVAASSQVQARAQAQDPEAQTDKTVTGYPVTHAYAAPPPPPSTQSLRRHLDTTSSYPPRYDQHDPHTSARLLRRLIVMVLAFLSVMALASLITWLVYRPQVPEFRVDSGSVSQLNTTASRSSLSATWEFTLTVKNPNKKLGISYNSLQAGVEYDGFELATTQLAPFSQEKGNETQVAFRMGAVDEYVDESVLSGIEKDWKTRGQVGFGVGVYGWVRYRTSWWEMRWRLMKVSCEGVNIRFSNNSVSGGNLTGRVDKCRVDM